MKDWSCLNFFKCVLEWVNHVENKFLSKNGKKVAHPLPRLFNLITGSFGLLGFYRIY